MRRVARRIVRKTECLTFTGAVALIGSRRDGEERVLANALAVKMIERYCNSKPFAKMLGGGSSG